MGIPSSSDASSALRISQNFGNRVATRYNTDPAPVIMPERGLQHAGDGDVGTLGSQILPNMRAEFRTTDSPYSLRHDVDIFN